MENKSRSSFASNFVSASAGSGKTKALIDRLLFLLLNQVKPHKILCLTYTKAAASEILSRIKQKLSQLCICNQEDLIKELKHIGLESITPELEKKARILFVEFIDAIETLKVQTIHAFCQELLMKFPAESDVNLNFTLLDNSQMIELIDQAKHSVFESANEVPQLKKALQYLSWHLKEYSLNELLKEIISNREKLDDFFSQNNNLSLEMPESEDKHVEEFIKFIPIKIANLDILKLGNKSDNSMSNDLKNFLSYNLHLQTIMITQYFNCFLNKTGAPFKSLLSKKLEKDHPELADLLFTEQQRVHQFSKNFNLIKTNNLTQGFIILSYYLHLAYQQLKKQNNSLDYSDLIHIANNLLSNNEHAQWIRYKLDGGIDHVLIDEAQDNSPKQWSIIGRITEEFFTQDEKNKSLFIVGDSKQSIFRFQGAAPEIFNSMEQLLPQEVLRTHLNTSFRSGSYILEVVDKIFNQPHIKPLVSGNEKVGHSAYRQFKGEVELWPLVIEPELKKNDSWVLPSHHINNPQLSADELLANNIADNINKWLQTKQFINSKNRIIQAGDILILTRRRNDFVSILIKTLRAKNISVAGIDRLKLLQHPAILDLIALSNFILFSEDDLSLAIILKSPMFNLSEEQLLYLCNNRQESLYKEIQKQPQYNHIHEFLKSLDVNSLLDFYFNLIEEKELRSKYLKYYGTEINDIFDSFLDLVETYESEKIPNLQSFIHFIENSEIEIQRDLSQNLNQVRIMTVHGSKGLQSPIVILTDTTSLPVNNDTIIWLNPDKLLWPYKVKYYSEEALKAKNKVADAEYAEYLRLLYVALTRAEDKIIVTGHSKSELISEKCWYSVIRDNLEII